LKTWEKRSHEEVGELGDAIFDRYQHLTIATTKTKQMNRIPPNPIPRIDSPTSRQITGFGGNGEWESVRGGIRRLLCGCEADINTPSLAGTLPLRSTRRCRQTEPSGHTG